MPLESGSSSAAVSHNIETEEAAGKPHAQAVAIALHNAKDVETFETKTVGPPGMSIADIQAANRKLWEPDKTRGVATGQKG